MSQAACFAPPSDEAAEDADTSSSDAELGTGTTVCPADTTHQVATAPDLVRLTNERKRAARVFCLKADRFAITAPLDPISGDRFHGRGPSSSGSVIAPANGATLFEIFHGQAVDSATPDNVVLEDLELSGAKLQPISGGYEKNASGKCVGAMGDRLTIRGSRGSALKRTSPARIHDCEAVGVGGSGEGAIIDNVEIYANGNCAVEAFNSGNVKSAKSYVVSNSYVHDSNVGPGIWCDVGCAGSTDYQGVRYDGMTVLNTSTKNNNNEGIRFERTWAGLVQGGEIVGNNRMNESGGHGGIAIVNSKNIAVRGVAATSPLPIRNNYKGAITVVRDGRHCGCTAYPTTTDGAACPVQGSDCDYDVANIKIQDAVLTSNAINVGGRVSDQSCDGSGPLQCIGINTTAALPPLTCRTVAACSARTESAQVENLCPAQL